MEKSIILPTLNNPQNLQQLRDYLTELFREVDPIYTESAPNGSISARRGKLALYNNSGIYTVWINLNGSTLWQQV